MFPWQSGSNGREETQRLHLNPKSGRWRPDHSHLQRHVNIAIAYNVCSTTWSPEHSFPAFHRRELLVEIARFWSSIATYNTEQDRYEIHGVMGPDEYHEGYPDSDEAGLQQHLYKHHGGLATAASFGGVGGTAAALSEGVVDELAIREEWTGGATLARS